MHEVNMTGTEYRGRRGHKNISSALSVTRFFSGSTIVAVLAIMASLLPGVTAAQAQVRRLELATQSSGTVYHRWSDDNGGYWFPWMSLDSPGDGAQGIPALVSDGDGRLYVISKTRDGFWQRMYDQGFWSDWTKIAGNGPCNEPAPWWRFWHSGAWIIGCA